MKTTLTLIAMTTLSATLACAQGTLLFDTSASGPGAKVLDANGLPGEGMPIGNTAAGTEPGSHYLMQLYAASGVTTDSSSLVPIGQPVNARGGTNNSGFNQIFRTTSLGLEADPVIVLPYLGIATVQLRAWWAGTNGATYPSYYDDGSDLRMRYGVSPLFTLPLADPTGIYGPPQPPSNLVGLIGFQLQVIPEPSAFVLLCFGALGLLAFQRK